MLLEPLSCWTAADKRWVLDCIMVRINLPDTPAFPKTTAFDRNRMTPMKQHITKITQHGLHHMGWHFRLPGIYYILPPKYSDTRRVSKGDEDDDWVSWHCLWHAHGFCFGQLFLVSFCHTILLCVGLLPAPLCSLCSVSLLCPLHPPKDTCPVSNQPC